MGSDNGRYLNLGSSLVRSHSVRGLLGLGHFAMYLSVLRMCEYCQICHVVSRILECCGHYMMYLGNNVGGWVCVVVWLS